MELYNVVTEIDGVRVYCSKNPLSKAKAIKLKEEMETHNKNRVFNLETILFIDTKELPEIKDEYGVVLKGNSIGTMFSICGIVKIDKDIEFEEDTYVDSEGLVMVYRRVDETHEIILALKEDDKLSVSKHCFNLFIDCVRDSNIGEVYCSGCDCCTVGTSRYQHSELEQSNQNRTEGGTEEDLKDVPKEDVNNNKYIVVIKGNKYIRPTIEVKLNKDGEDCSDRVYIDSEGLLVIRKVISSGHCICEAIERNDIEFVQGYCGKLFSECFLGWVKTYGYSEGTEPKVHHIESDIVTLKRMIEGNKKTRMSEIILGMLAE